MPQPHGELYLKPLQVPKGARIIGFELHMVAGVFYSVEEIPTGWKVAVDDDPSWTTSLEASAKPGAVALDEKSFGKIGIEVVKNESADTKFNIWGWLTLASGTETSKRVPLNSFSFDFVERYSRHKLHYVPNQ